MFSCRNAILLPVMCACFALTAAEQNYADPFPPPAERGAPSQPAHAIILFENFEHTASKIPGLTGNGWKGKSDDALPLTYMLPEALANGVTALSIEWWMKFEIGSQPPNGTLIHGPGWKISFNGNQSPHGTMHIRFQQARQGAWIGAAGPEIPLGVPDGQWHCYTATFDLHEIAVYFDGEIYSRDWQGNNADRIGPMADGSNEPDKTAIEVGGKSDGRWPDFAFTGVAVDELRVSSIALNALQVRTNFENYRANAAILYAAPSAPVDGDGTAEHPMPLASALAKAAGVTRIVMLPGKYNAADFHVAAGGPSPIDELLIMGQAGKDPALIAAAENVAGPSLTGAGYVTLRNLNFEAGAHAALSVDKFQGRVRLDACRIASAGDGIAISASPNTVLENCVIKVSGAGSAISAVASPNCAFKNNTIVGGSTGLNLTRATAQAAVLNNLFDGQTNSCIASDDESLRAYRGDGNCFNPKGGTLAQLGAQKFSPRELDGFRKRLYQIDFPKDKDKKLTAYGPENHSTALTVSFLDAEHSDYRLAATPGNPLDAGSAYAGGELPGLRRVEAPLTDANGAPRPQGNAVDAGAFESAAPLAYAFTLEKNGTTSAGVYREDGTLVRTLWSAQALNAGEHTAYWNGLNDYGETVSDSEYTITVAAHNITYVWEGVIGNTSASFNGPTVHSAFLPMQSLCFAGNSGFYVSGYNELGLTQFRFDTKNPQALTGKIGASDYKRAFNLAATDGAWVYFVDTNPPGLLVAADARDGKPVKFSTGRESGHWNGVELGAKEGLLGLAVQPKGDLLFVASSSDNRIQLYDKRSGTPRGVLPVTAPGRIATGANGELWVCCKWDGKPAVVCFTGFTKDAKPTVVLQDLAAPAAVAVSPTDGTVLVADAGDSQQLKGFSPDGKLQWTYGQKSGYDTGPAVTTDKFFFKQTLLAFQPDGTFWVKDEATNRVLHFAADRRYIDCIMYQPHPFTQTTDPNDPKRAFVNWLEFAIDYSKPLSEPGAWTLVNYWGHKLPASAYNGFDDGLYRVVTLKNGRTYGFILGGEFSAKKVVELTAKGLRLSAAPPLDGKIKMEDDGALTWVERDKDRANFIRRDLAPFAPSDDGGDPHWEQQRFIAQAPISWNRNTGGPDWRGGEPVGDDLYFSQWRLLNGLSISFNGERYSAGFHLGAVRTGDTRWYWMTAPSGPMDGHGTFDTNVEYAGRALQVSGRHIVFNLHGEFWHGGQSNQFFDYLDNGLFVGQFGQPNVFGIGGDAQQSRVPGAAGNSFAMTLATVGDKLYVYHNDENGHGGSQRWRIDGWQDVREFSGKVRVGGK